MKKILLFLAVAVLTLTGCTFGKQSGEVLDSSTPRIVVIEQLSIQYYIVADMESGYEYFASRSYNNAYVIGGNVLDKDGKPVKFEGGGK